MSNYESKKEHFGRQADLVVAFICGALFVIVIEMAVQTI